MKVTVTKPEFNPISITLESEDELTYMLALVGSVSGMTAGRKFTSKIYDTLLPLSKDKEAHFDIISGGVKYIETDK